MRPLAAARCFEGCNAPRRDEYPRSPWFRCYAVHVNGTWCITLEFRQRRCRSRRFRVPHRGRTAWSGGAPRARPRIREPAPTRFADARQSLTSPRRLVFRVSNSTEFSRRPRRSLPRWRCGSASCAITDPNCGCGCRSPMTRGTPVKGGHARPHPNREGAALDAGSGERMLNGDGR
jgi:hypothetical protein